MSKFQSLAMRIMYFNNVTANQTSDDDQIPGWDGIYIRNSYPFSLSASEAPAIYAWQYASISISAAILLHSYSINGSRRSTVRIITDIAAVTTFGESLIVILILDNYISSPKAQCYLSNVVGQAILGALNQFADNYGAYSRYIIINPKFPTILKIFTFFYVLGLMYCTWIPIFTILPWFINLNDPSELNAINTLNNTYSYSYITFDCVFTLLLLYELYKRQQSSSMYGLNDEYSLYIIALKAIVHNTLSIIGVYSFSNNTSYGLTWSNLCVAVSLHLINWKFEKYFKVCGPKNPTRNLPLSASQISAKIPRKEKIFPSFHSLRSRFTMHRIAPSQQ